MSGFVQGIKYLFTGSTGQADASQTAALEAEQARQREQQTIASERQRQELQVEQGRQDEQLGRARRLPRGRRLLLAAGDASGLASTLGG